MRVIGDARVSGLDEPDELAEREAALDANETVAYEVEVRGDTRRRLPEHEHDLGLRLDPGERLWGGCLVEVDRRPLEDDL